MTIHSSPEESYKLLASVITGLLCCFSKIDSTSLRLFQGSRNRAYNNLGKFQHVTCFHVGLSLTSKGTFAQHVCTCNSSSPPHVVVASKPSKIRLSAAMIRQPPCEDPSRRTPQPAITKSNEGQIVQRNRRNSNWHACMLPAQTNDVCLLHVCQPPLLMHVHLGEETYSHRDPDESGFPTNSQNQTLLEAE